MERENEGGGLVDVVVNGHGKAVGAKRMSCTAVAGEVCEIVAGSPNGQFFGDGGAATV